MAALVSQGEGLAAPTPYSEEAALALERTLASYFRSILQLHTSESPPTLLRRATHKFFEACLEFAPPGLTLSLSCPELETSFTCHDPRSLPTPPQTSHGLPETAESGNENASAAKTRPVRSGTENSAPSMPNTLALSTRSSRRRGRPFSSHASNALPRNESPPVQEPVPTLPINNTSLDILCAVALADPAEGLQGGVMAGTPQDNETDTPIVHPTVEPSGGPHHTAATPSVAPGSPDPSTASEPHKKRARSEDGNYSPRKMQKIVPSYTTLVVTGKDSLPKWKKICSLDLYNVVSSTLAELENDDPLASDTKHILKLVLVFARLFSQKGNERFMNLVELLKQHTHQRKRRDRNELQNDAPLDDAVINAYRQHTAMGASAAVDGCIRNVRLAQFARKYDSMVLEMDNKNSALRARVSATGFDFDGKRAATVAMDYVVWKLDGHYPSCNPTAASNRARKRIQVELSLGRLLADLWDRFGLLILFLLSDSSAGAVTVFRGWSHAEVMIAAKYYYNTFPIIGPVCRTANELVFKPLVHEMQDGCKVIENLSGNWDWKGMSSLPYVDRVRELSATPAPMSDYPRKMLEYERDQENVAPITPDE